jgi:putative ABC transport system substrate-binding protein
MRRRELLWLGGAALLFQAGNLRAQDHKKVYRVGMLSAGLPPKSDDPAWVAFRQGFRDLGYAEGQNLALEGRFAGGDLDRLPGMAAELAAMNVDAVTIFGPGPMRAAAAKPAVPIVMVASSSDPVGEGYIASFARPGGNITGLTYAVSSDRFAKQLEILKEAVGTLSRVAVLWDADPDLFQRTWRPALDDAARHLGLVVTGPYIVSKPEDFQPIFANMRQDRPDGLLVATTGVIFPHRDRVAKLAIQHRLATIAAFREFPQTGRLLSYGPNIAAIDAHRPLLIRSSRARRPERFLSSSPQNMTLCLI